MRVHVCVHVFLLKTCHNLQELKICERSSPLDESFKVHFQVALANKSRLQPTASTPSPGANTRQLLNLTCLYWSTGPFLAKQLRAANPQDVFNF